MNKDSVGGVLIIGVLVVSIVHRKFTEGILELLVHLSRPGSTILLLGGVVLLFTKGYGYSSLALALLSIYLLKDMWKWSQARRIFNDVQADQRRFDPSLSVDLQWAQKSATHDAPSMLTSSKSENMLVFPPSPETLAQLSGE
jgi:hypothetical protein